MDLKQTEENTPEKLHRDNQNPALRAIKHLNSYDSPFSQLPKYSTPPSRFVKIKNPFEASLIERLHLPVFSPSVFNRTTPKSSEKFKWSIDDISILKPADIDETTMNQVESPIRDPELESSAQERIDRYFNEKHIVPSPLTNATMPQNLISTTPPYSTMHLINTIPTRLINNETQTTLTLPPCLPPDVEAVLKPYFSYKGNDLYRQLFESPDEVVVSSSVESSPAQPCNLSPVQYSPCEVGRRDFESPSIERDRSTDRDSALSNCNLSPIWEETTWKESRSVARLDLSNEQNMSIDVSMNLVPNVYVLPGNDSTAPFDMESPVREILSDSTANWDVEFNTVNIVMEDEDLFMMDVKNACTPKKKKYAAFRRNLSNSFQMDLDKDLSDEYDENQDNDCGYVQKETTLDDRYLISDAYSDDTNNLDHLVASTPTKDKC